jgi:hypothetical protein
MEHDIVDGESAPAVGDHVRIRVLRNADGEMAVDRPYRDRPLELSAGTDIAIPAVVGTYEVRGEVNRVALATSEGTDHLFLSVQSIEKIADEIVELPREKEDLGWEDSDASGVDVDIESIVSTETVTEESESRPTAGEAETLSESYNQLLLDTL